MPEEQEKPKVLYDYILWYLEGEKIGIVPDHTFNATINNMGLRYFGQIVIKSENDFMRIENLLKSREEVGSPYQKDILGLLRVPTIIYQKRIATIRADTVDGTSYNQDIFDRVSVTSVKPVYAKKKN